eukprot:g32573.t1
MPVYLIPNFIFLIPHLPSGMYATTADIVRLMAPRKSCRLSTMPKSLYYRIIAGVRPINFEVLVTSVQEYRNSSFIVSARPLSILEDMCCTTYPMIRTLRAMT